MKKYLLPLILTLILIFNANCFATPWDVSTAVYADKSAGIGSQEGTPRGMTFSSDGSKMYVVGDTNDTVYQYTLSTPWDVSTATYATKLKDVGSQATYPLGVAFSSDGSKMYVVGKDNDTVYQYTVSTPWDVSTATYANKSKLVSAQDTYPYEAVFNPDGSIMYIMGYLNSSVFQYTLSTPWDVSTATYATKLKDVGAQEGYPFGVAFNPDGNKMYIVGAYRDKVWQYALSTPWDVSTAEYADKFKLVSAQDTFPYKVKFNSDGSKMYILGNGTDTVYQYTLPAPPVVEVNNLFFGSNF